MECLILGSGTIIQSDYQRNCSGYLIDRSLLIDCGPGVWKSLGASGISADKIHTILLTHFHADHISDLLPFMLARYLSLQDQTTELRIYGPVGLKDWFYHLGMVAGSWMSDLKVKLNEVTTAFSVDAFDISPAVTGHTDNSLCYRITGPRNRVLFYSGDSDYNETLIRQALQADLCILEASNTVATKIDGHMTPALAGKIARKAGVRHLVLTHMYPEVLAIDAEREAASHFDGKITLARDGTNVIF